MQKPHHTLSILILLFISALLAMTSCSPQVIEPENSSSSEFSDLSSETESLSNLSSSSDSTQTSSSSIDSVSSSSLTISSSSTGPTLVTHTYPKTEGPDKNPMKGWNTGWWNDYEFASVGFQYIPWKTLEPNDDQFDFAAVEEIIARPGSAGRHFILRLFCDWDGLDDPSRGCPAWLYSEHNVQRMQDSTGRYLTNFNDANYIAEAQETIRALAEHYDQDPIAYAFQIGVLGYWGEWHTFMFKGDFSLSEETKNAVLSTYKESFSHAQIMGRYPWREPLASENQIGYHNDFFGPLSHSDEFDQSISTQMKWLEGPIGGEMPPSITSTQLEQTYNTSKGIEMISKGHYSTMQPHGNPCADSPESSNCLGFMKIHRLMGYNFQIDSAIFADSIEAINPLEVEINGVNIGVAPFYRNWQVQMALLDSAQNQVAIRSISTDLRLIKDQDSFSFSENLELEGIAVGVYSLALRVIQPSADQPKPNSWGLDARNTYIEFANSLEIIEGNWSNENSLMGGWMILGEIEIY